MKERGFFVFVIILIVFFLNTFFASADNVTSLLNVTNSPPVLLFPIPNQSWQTNENLTNVFVLDDYFIDPNGDSITFYYTQPANITVVVNSSNVVSFYPDLDYLGISTMVFYAGDDYNNATSNLVYLNVGADSTAPQWSNPSRTITTVYQNTYLNFTTLWTDDFQLLDYSFFINQGAGISNGSFYSFSGMQNISNIEVQISAPASTVVYWGFCARDTNLNANCTDLQNFTVSAQNVTSTSSSTSSTSSGGASGTGDGGGDSGGLFGGGGPAGTKKALNFSVDPEFYKISLKQGQVETRVLRISNIGNQNLSFQLILESLDDFVTLSERDFFVEFGETKSVTVDFEAAENAIGGQYNGEIIVNSSIGEFVVPVVIDVNALEFEFEIKVNVSEDSKRVSPGDLVEATISIMNLKDIPFSEVNLYYAIKDFEGNTYDSSEEFFNLESAVSLDRNLTLPKDAPVGMYLFYARLTHDNFVAIDSDLFQAGSLFDFASFFRYTFFVITIIVLSAMAIILFLKYRHQKEKERLLSLYMMLTEMKKLISQKKVDEAIDLYIRIKSIYGEPVSKTALENKQKLKEEISKLSDRLKEEVSLADEVTQNEIKEAAGEKTKEDSLSSETKKNMEQNKSEKKEVKEISSDEKEGDKNED